MASDFVNNINLDSNNSLTHLISEYFEIEENEPILLQNSKYYDKDMVINSKELKDNNFLFLSLNCCSFSTYKFDQLVVFLNELNQSTCVSVIALQETWFSDLLNLSEYEIPNYNIISIISHSSKHGGLVLYLHESFSYKILNFPHSKTIWDALFIMIENQLNGEKVVIGNVYRPPHKHVEDIITFKNEFSDILETASNKKYKCFIAGDINIDLLRINEITNYRDFFNDVISASFIPLITLPTRFSSRNSLIDNIFTNSFKTKLCSGILTSHFSDHQMYFTATLSKSFSEQKSTKYIEKTVNQSIALEKFSVEFEKKFNNNMLSTDENACPNCNYNILENIISDCYKLAFKKKTVKFTRQKHFLNNWMTPGLLKSINYKNKLYKNMILNRNNETLYKNLKQNFNTYLKILKNTIRERKKAYHFQLFTKYKNNI